MHSRNTDVRNIRQEVSIWGWARLSGVPQKGVHSPAFGRLLLSIGGHLAVKERGPGEMEFSGKTWWPKRAGSRSGGGSYFHRSEHTW